jgi:phage tail-like protein
MTTTIETSPTFEVSLSQVATDPIRNFKFHVNMYNGIKGSDGQLASALGFMTAGGLNLSTEVIPYRQGGYNTTPQKLPGQTDFSPLTLGRGVLLGSDQNWKAQSSLFVVQQGTGSGTPGNNFRWTTDLLVLDHPVTNGSGSKQLVPVKMFFRLYRTWPSSIGYSDMDAGGNGFMVEQMTLVHEGFAIGWASNKAGATVTSSNIPANN